MENEKQMYSTEVIDLPSGGKLYSPDDPLYSGKIELKYDDRIKLLGNRKRYQDIMELDPYNEEDWFD